MTSAPPTSEARAIREAGEAGVEDGSAERRLERARAWLATHPPSARRLVIAPSFDAGMELGRTLAAHSERGAVLGLHCETLPRLAASIVAPQLAARGVSAIGALAGEAVMARALRPLLADAGNPWLARVADAPGLPRVLWRTVDELRRAAPELSAIEGLPSEISMLGDAYARELAAAGLADRAAVLWQAVEAARDAAAQHPLLGLPTLFVDLEIGCEAEAQLVAALAERAPGWFATLPRGDEALARALGVAGFPGASDGDAAPSGALARLQRFLFEEDEGAARAARASEADDQVIFTSAPGEGRECVELVREMRRFAAQGVPFDRMAVLLRSPGEYRGTLEEAFERADIPFHSARGTTRPDPAGRAFLALLGCAADGLSARQFAEYLSLAQLPDDAAGAGAALATTVPGTAGRAPPEPANGEPEPARPSDAEPARAAGLPAEPESGSGAASAARRTAAREWVAPDVDLLPRALAQDEGQAEAAAHDELAELEAEIGAAVEGARVVAGTLRTPRRFEQLLIDAAVIGGRERWELRLDGLAAQLELAARSAELEESDDEQRAARLREQRLELEALRVFAVPLVERLAQLPETASWGEWIERLGSLADAALRHPKRVHSVLSELLPMAGVDAVDLAEVRRILDARLRDVAVPPGPDRYGKVYVASCEAARGLAFEVVFVPGLAEKLFPGKIVQDPVLGDAARRALSVPGFGLPTSAERVARERGMLRIAVGAAKRAVVLSYPRVDVDRNRPRVPSFYALEAVRAAEGRLPGFDEFARRAEGRGRARLGWPAPATRAEAIDEAEHDLVLLQELLHASEIEASGRAHFLLSANPHLGRALRFRARRWLRGWSVADGLVKLEQDASSRVAPHALAAIAEHALAARSYSATALQGFAECPYRFFLYAVLRLSPREVPQAIDELDALQRGSLVHDVLFEFLQEQAAAGALPVTPARFEAARAALDAVVGRVAARYREELAPAIARVWEDGVSEIRADLREWLRRMSERDDGFVPAHFELAFGLGQGSLASRELSDAASTRDAAVLDCGVQLRGSIDMIERRTDGGTTQLRVVDHKTGRARFGAKAVIDGGKALQPVFYALAAEKLFPEAEVEEGSLSYCTSAGGFSERRVALDASARAAADVVAQTVGAALDAPFLPAAPAPMACRYCDFRPVCGPYEELRTGRKERESLAGLEQLRKQR